MDVTQHHLRLKRQLKQWFGKRTGGAGVMATLQCINCAPKSAETCLGLVCVADDNCDENCFTRHVVPHLSPTFGN